MFKNTDDFKEIRTKEFHRISGKTKKCYDPDQRALFGSRTVKASVYYTYLPAEEMEDGIPFIISSGVSFDGGKEQEDAVKNGAMSIRFDDLKKVFINNKFNENV